MNAIDSRGSDEIKMIPGPGTSPGQMLTVHNDYPEGPEARRHLLEAQVSGILGIPDYEHWAEAESSPPIHLSILTGPVCSGIDAHSGRPRAPGEGPGTGERVPHLPTLGDAPAIIPSLAVTSC